VPLTGEGLAPAIAVSPEAISFESIETGESATEAFTVENTGSAPLEGSVSLDADTNAFTLASGSGDFTLAPEETQEVEVTFAPDVASSFTGTVAISHNASNQADPVEVPLTGEGLAPAIAISPETVSFGDVLVGESVTEVLTVENTGSAPLEGSVSLDADTDAFTLASGSGDFTLAPEETREVEVTFAPGAASSFEGTVAISHNADNEADPVEVPLTGEGLASAIAVDAEAISFDNVTAGESATEVLTVENTGSAPLEGSVSLDADTDAFTLTSGSGDFTLAPEETREVEVTFAPGTASSFAGTVAISHNASNEADPFTKHPL